MRDAGRGERHGCAADILRILDSVDVHCAELTLEVISKANEHLLCQWSAFECLMSTENRALRCSFNALNCNVALRQSDSAIHQVLLPCEWSGFVLLTFYFVQGLCRFQLSTFVRVDMLCGNLDTDVVRCVHNTMDELRHIFASLVPKSTTTPSSESPALDQSLDCYFQDDLRCGKLKYVTLASDVCSVPAPLEIHFHEATEQHAAAMVWTYPEPRFLRELHLTPVPFRHLESTDSQHSARLACTLQYYDPAADSFLNYVHFSLNENELYQVTLPTVASSQENAICAFTWRVILDAHQTAVYVSPLTLAACIRLDSCFVAQYTPHTALCVSLPQIALHLQSHGTEVLRVVLQRLEVEAVVCPTLALASSELASLTVTTCQPVWQRMVPFLHKVACRAKFQCRFPRGTIAVQLMVEPLHAQFDEDTVGALQLAFGVKEPAGLMLYNSTGVKLFVRQAAVTWCSEELLDENAHSVWCWSSTQHPAQLQLAVAHDDVLFWSQEIDLPEEAQQRLCTWRCPEQSIALVVERSKSQLQLRGALLLENRLSCSMELQTFVSESTKPMTVCLAPGDTRSLAVELNQLRGSRLRLASPALSEKSLPWSESLIFTQGLNASWRLKLWYHSDSGDGDLIACTHIWCTLRQDDAIMRLLFSPLYLLENLMPGTLYATTEGGSSSLASCVVVPGCGEEMQHLSWGRFEPPLEMYLYWSRDSAALEPPLRLPTDLEKIEVLPLLNRSATASWPFVADEDKEVQTSEDGWCLEGVQLTYASLRRRWSDSPTILLSVTPWLLLVNCCEELDLLVQCGTGNKPVHLAADGGTWVPPTDFDFLCVGVSLFGSCHWSTWLVLIDQSLFPNAPSEPGVLHPGRPLQLHIPVTKSISLELNAFLRHDSDSGLFMQLTFCPSFRIVNDCDFAFRVRACQLPNTSPESQCSSQAYLSQLCGEEAALCVPGRPTRHSNHALAHHICSAG